MSLLSELTLKPAKSKLYLRLVIVLNLLTVALIFYSSVYLLIKAGFIFFLIIRLTFDILYQNPCSFLNEIIFRNKSWFLMTREGETQHYEEARILIQNTLFQLIQFSVSKKNKLIILFNDQIPKEQLQTFNLLITCL